MGIQFDASRLDWVKTHTARQHLISLGYAVASKGRHFGSAIGRRSFVQHAANGFMSESSDHYENEHTNHLSDPPLGLECCTNDLTTELLTNLVSG